LLKRFVKYYRPHLPLFILDFSCAFAIAGLDLVFPVAVQWIIDQIFPQHDLDLLARICAGLLGLYLLRALLQYIVDYWGHVLGVRMEYDMRQDLFDHIQLSKRYLPLKPHQYISTRSQDGVQKIIHKKR